MRSKQNLWRKRAECESETMSLAFRCDRPGLLIWFRFRWVACQIDALKNCLDYPILQRTLRNLPKTLDETYTRILESISGEHSAQAATILSLLVWSDWRFTINELVDAIATDLDADPAFDPKNRMPVPRDVLKLCSSLVAVTQNGTNPGMEMVQLAHSSVKEYLISDHVSKTFESLSRETVARSYLARLCLRYLTGVAQITLRTRTSQLDFEEICQQFPFAKYSAQSWMEHARETEDEDDGLCKMVSSFFIEEHNGFSLFREMYDCRNSHERSPLYYAASNGWTRTIEDLLELGADVNAADGAALFAALRSDNSKTVQLSLDRGSDVNARDGRALSEASEYGYDSMIQLLLDRGADVNARDGEALLMASTRGHDMTVQLLLDRGADVDANDGEALLLASRTGNDIIVQLLLDGGADPNAQGQSKLPALQGVLMCAYQDLVNLLYKGASRATALDSALLRSYYKIAETLLGKGANIFPGGDWFYTLHADGWNDQIVRRTLERNAPLSANHLLSAMMDNDPQAKSIISVMLPYLTLEVAAARRKYWPWMNLLHYAAMCGSETVTQRCLDLGIDIDAQEDSGRTALHYAADHRCLPIVKMLVQAGSNTNLRELEDHTPLECAQVEDSFMALPTYLEEIRRQTPRWEVVDYLSEITQRTIAEPSIDQNHANRKRKRSPEDIGGTGR
jgi:ankyrin repeat protein